MSSIYVFYVWILCMYSMYVFYVCIRCMHPMYSMYVFYMYSIYVFYVCIKYQTYQKSYYLKCHQIDKVIGILMKPRMQNQNFDFLKIALNRVLTLPDYRSRRELPGSSGIIDFENKNISVVTKHWNYRISVPMSYISSCELHKLQT